MSFPESEAHLTVLTSVSIDEVLVIVNHVNIV